MSGSENQESALKKKNPQVILMCQQSSGTFALEHFASKSPKHCWGSAIMTHCGQEEGRNTYKGESFTQSEKLSQLFQKPPPNDVCLHLTGPS